MKSGRQAPLLGSLLTKPSNLASFKIHGIAVGQPTFLLFIQVVERSPSPAILSNLTSIELSEPLLHRRPHQWELFRILVSLPSIRSLKAYGLKDGEKLE